MNDGTSHNGNAPNYARFGSGTPRCYNRLALAQHANRGPYPGRPTERHFGGFAPVLTPERYALRKAFRALKGAMPCNAWDAPTEA